MRTCFIHVGTHKTGTTSQQATLNRHRADLERSHYLYPLAGKPSMAPDGHHNIAWEITGDWRFRKEHGTIDDLMAEILAAPHDIILSSEDFECSIHHPEPFRQFVRRLQACQLAVKIVVYLRNQVDYAQSLYLTMLYFGIVESFDEFVNGIVDDGQFRWRDWTCSFCYRSLLTRLRAFDDVDVIVRSYDRPRDGSLIVDYLSVFGLDQDTLGVDTTIRANVRPNVVDALGLFYGNRKGRPPDRVEAHVIESVFGHLREKRVGVSTGSKQKIVDRFRDFGYDTFPEIGIAGLERVESTVVDPDREGEALSMEGLFSPGLAERIDSVAGTFRAEHEAGSTLEPFSTIAQRL